jgi:dienelactone hydrolase
LRAVSYSRSAEYFSDPFGPEGLRFGRAGRDAFLAAAPDLPHRIEPVDIPFGDTPLPGYLMHPAGAENGNRTIVVLTGFDGTGEELYFQTAADALARGFTVLIAEGPGQVGCLRRHQGLLFRPDYEVPIAAMLDFALTRPEIDPDRIALYGISFGGYFVIRAGVHDRRIAALIANSPIVDLAAYIGGFAEEPPDAEEEEDVSLDELDEVPDSAIPKVLKLTLKSAFLRFGVTSVAGWLNALEAYRVEGLERIACPSLALAGTGEGGETVRQLEAFCAGVSGPVTRRLFVVEEGADMHWQLGNLPLSNAVIYDWLSDTLG